MVGDSPIPSWSMRPSCSEGVAHRLLVASPHSCPGPRARITQGRVQTSRFTSGGAMLAPTVFVGVDVAKATLDVAVRPAGERWSVANDEPGIQSLVARLLPLGPVLVVLEATGGFEHAAAAALGAARLGVVIANPRQVRAFARAIGQLAKTDAIDAQVLALFAERVQPTPRPLPAHAAPSTGRDAGGREEPPQCGPPPRPPWHQATHPLAGAPTRGRRPRARGGHPGEPPVAGTRRPAAERAGCGPGVEPDAPGRVARARPPQPQGDRGAGGGGTAGPRQWDVARPARGVGWSGARARRPLHGDRRGGAVQPGHPGVLLAAAGRRQAGQSRAHGVHAKTADDPQRDGAYSVSLAASSP